MVTQSVARSTPPPHRTPLGRPGDWRTLPAIDERALPSTDGRPMADNTRQAQAIVYTFGALVAHFRPRPEVTIAANLLLHYPLAGRDPRDGPSAYGQLAPDVFVADAPMRNRPSYRVGPDQPPPRLVLEMLSQKTLRRDLEPKRDVYEQLGVYEYFLFDSRESPRTPRLEGLRLRAGRYRTIPSLALPNGAAGIPSEVLQLTAWVNDDELRWFDPAAGEDLRSHTEEREGRLDAEERVRQAEVRAEGALARERMAVRRMHSAGIAAEEIARLLDIDADTVRRALA